MDWFIDDAFDGGTSWSDLTDEWLIILYITGLQYNILYYSYNSFFITEWRQISRLEFYGAVSVL